MNHDSRFTSEYQSQNNYLVFTKFTAGMLMSFKDWRLWFGDLHWSLKWFIIFILIRPIIDNFYYLKEISPFISPLYIVGVATPLFALYAIAVLKKPNYSRLDVYFGIFTTIVSISALALLISDSFSFDAIEFSLKFTFPFFMYFFCRRLIRSKTDLHGVLQAFLYSSVFVAGIFSYEIIFNPINIQVSRGLERFLGSFADIMNYAIYLTCSLLIVSYAYIQQPASNNKSNGLVLVVITFIISLTIMINIHHTATYVVFTAIVILFLMHILRADLGVGFIVLVAIVGLVYFTGPESFEEKIMPLIETDISVYEGDKDNEALLHGRVGRWMRFYDYFVTKSSFVQLFGLPLDMDRPYSYIAKGAHNDFVRTLMFSGYIGLLVYLSILISLFLRVLKYSLPMHYLGLGTLAMLILYSVSTTPLLYAPLMYLLMPIICILALPKQIME